MSSLQASFKLALGNPILQGMATVAKFDGKHPSLACGTIGNRVFVYSPHTTGDNSRVDVRFLNINRVLRALSSGYLGNNPNEVLFVGSPTHILAYDVERNQDIFFKEIADGVTTIAAGNLESMSPTPLCFIGGNCSIQGFDFEGEEKFWTVAGDNVRTLQICDIDKDGKNEVISGTDDFEIRIVRCNGDVVAESTQTDKVLFVRQIPMNRQKDGGNRFAYALDNGTVGLYEVIQGKLKRKWRVKSKHKVCALNVFDMQQSGSMDIIIGWSSGKIEVRHEGTGDVLMKDSFDSAIAAILISDLRLDGREQDGEVRGYVPLQKGQGPSAEEAAAAEEALLAQLTQVKQELLYEIKSYEDNQRHLRTGQMKQGEGQLMMLPVDTRIVCQWKVDESKRLVRLTIATNNTMVVRGVVIFADQLFEGESFCYVPKDQDTEARVPICPAKDVSSDLFLKVLIGPRNGDLYHVVEQNYTLPRFSMYAPLPAKTQKKPPDAKVVFQFGERAARVVEWLNTSFNISFEHGNARSVSVGFTSLRDDSNLWIIVDGDRVEFRTENMELAGDLVQDLADFTGCEELSSSAEFPAAMAKFKQVHQVLAQVDEYNASRLALAAGSAELTNVVKDLVVRAEDSRMLGELGLMSRTYAQIMSKNRELLAEHAKRATNQQALLDALKQVNQMIQRAARLRVGAEKAAVIANCREALKGSKLQLLFDIIQTGKLPQ